MRVPRSAHVGLRISIGDRISGWAFAHKQAVINSNAALEFGSVARATGTSLRYAIAIPILNGPGTPLGVLTCYGTEPFNNDHHRMLESAATLFASTASTHMALAAAPPPATEIRDLRVHCLCS